MPLDKLLPRLQPFRHQRERELANWLTLEHRLAEVEKALEMLLPLLAQAEPASAKGKEADASLLVRSLYCFAVVTYVRCFNSGRRQRLKIDDMTGVGRRQRELHDSIVATRNRHLAHAVDDEEETYIFLCRDPGKIELKGFHVLSVVLASDSLVTARRFLALVRRIRRYTNREASRVGDEVARTFFRRNAKWSKLAVF